MCFFSSMQFYHMCRFNKYEGLQTSVVTGISFRCAHFDHRGYLGHEDFFFFLIVFLCHLFLVSSASVRSIQFPSFIKPIFAWNIPLVSLILFNESLVFSILLVSSICTDHCGRLSYLSLLFFGTLYSNGYIFPFSFAFCFSSFHSYLQSLLRQPFCFSAFLFLEDDLDPCLLYSITNLCP